MADASLGVALARVVIVLGLLWIVMRIIRRVSGRSRGAGATRSARSTCSIELINRRAIGRTASVAAVRVGDKMYVLGITDQRIEKLDERDAPDLDLEAIELSSAFSAEVPSVRRRSSFLDSLRERTVR